MTLRRNICSLSSPTGLPLCPSPMVPGMFRTALPAQPHAAAESGSRQCSQPGAGKGANKDLHAKGWLMAQPFEGPMAVSPPSGERSSGRGFRRVRLRDCCSHLGTGAWARVGRRHWAAAGTAPCSSLPQTLMCVGSCGGMSSPSSQGHAATSARSAVGLHR